MHMSECTLMYAHNTFKRGTKGGAVVHRKALKDSRACALGWQEAVLVVHG